MLLKLRVEAKAVAKAMVEGVVHREVNQPLPVHGMITPPKRFLGAAQARLILLVTSNHTPMARAYRFPPEHHSKEVICVKADIVHALEQHAQARGDEKHLAFAAELRATDPSIRHFKSAQVATGNPQGPHKRV